MVMNDLNLLAGVRPGVVSACSLVLIAAIVGCGPGAGPSGSASSSNAPNPYLLAEEPTEPVGVDEVFSLLPEAGERTELTLVGRIPKQLSQGLSPWGENEATFVVIEATTEGETAHAGPGHDPDNCPFCKRRREEGKSTVNSLALIQIVDDDGKVLPSDVRSLLGLQESQIVVARGEAVRDSLGNITLATKGLFIRPED
jgi:hypothetical protein